MSDAINIQAREPAYLQVAAWLREGIREGRWGPGEPIPSNKWLEHETGLSLNTVRKAIKVLLDEGLVHAVQGRGTFVGPPPE